MKINEISYGRAVVSGKIVPDGYAIHLTKLGKFHVGVDPLATYAQERLTHTFALHPDYWQWTFYSLTNKEAKKLKYYSPKIIEILPNTLVGDMAIANQFYRNENAEEFALLYIDSLKSIEDVNLADYKLPELLIP
jgi:hypothetical protein